ncbi:MAG: hypothetical protein NW202_13405 [Nitrospira sp.]|nr:hypothetical protein [Nitrospira sp.]
MKRIDKRNRTFESEPFDGFVKHLHRVIDPILDAVLDRLNLLLTDTDTFHETVSTATYSWNGYLHGVQCLTVTTVAAIEIGLSTTSADLGDWQVGRRMTLCLLNSTGGPLAVTFTSDFLANGVAALADGSAALWTFVVKHPDFSSTQTLLEV